MISQQNIDRLVDALHNLVEDCNEYLNVLEFPKEPLEESLAIAEEVLNDIENIQLYN